MNKTEVFFENQRKIIIDNINRAKSSIMVAMELFTDNTLFDLLVKKAQEGVRVQLIISDDEINTTTGINYSILKEMRDFCSKKNA